MLRFLGTVITSLVVSFGVLLAYEITTKYTPGDQFNDAAMCVLTLGSQLDQKLTFNITGVLGERSGDLKWLWIIGEDVAFGDTNRPIYCRIEDGKIEVSHPTLGVFKSE
jgi:hypothetical protein